MRFYIDSFSGAASDLKGRNRTAANVLEALRRDPRLSTWDMSEHRWLCSAIKQLKDAGQIVELSEPYPWHRFAVLKPKDATTEDTHV